ncbi:hypothetical protein [Cohnella sp. 56]|uniref:hypothetical protein n=1 Tax=Cohnella sp. 56 TaxID=3113722 RepID=UPI0030EA3BE7
MNLSELKIENFRMYGEGDQSFIIPLHPGLTALMGEMTPEKQLLLMLFVSQWGLVIKILLEWKKRIFICHETVIHVEQRLEFDANSMA